MSEWAYRKCKECGDRVHLNSRCDCGGDPWSVTDTAKKSLIELEKMKDKHLKILKDIELEITRINEIIQSSQ